ncbi:MAG: hybrid sensor histidine kinase/response regulator, partial [Bacteroidetes bacterium]|nr:hybrid sensor histidine kinase/response regulator [Bacteroidota bacterium]
DTTIVNIQCLAEDAAGNLWGGNYSSLIRIDREQKQHRKFELGYTVGCIHEDRSGNFWVGTQGGGLLLFDRNTGSYKRFDEHSGLRSNTILRILEDPGGNLWMSTFNGLVRFDARERSFRSFLQSDGLQSDQFSFNAAVALRSGEFLFGGIKGFNLFYPDSIYGQASKPAIYLTAIRVEDHPLTPASRYVVDRQLEDIRAIEVPYEAANLSFDFVSPEYSAPDKIQYAYYLEGWDSRWNFNNMVRTARYSRLREGSYTLILRATDALGRWGKDKKVLFVRVLPPWYRTWWAYLLYGLCLAGAVFLYVRYTRKQERLRYEIKLAHLENEKDKELNEKKLSFFTNISHEFRTPLSLIINPLKEARERDKELTTAYRNARRLLSLVDQLLLFRKADSGADVLKISRLDIAEITREVYLCFIQQAKAKGIDYGFVGELADPVVYADREKIEIALFNLLSNAFKFTPDGGRIRVVVAENSGEVSVTVEDSGPGIAASDMEGIFGKFRGMAQKGFGIGLYLVKHFVESHRGRVYCQSEIGRGARFTI